MKHTGMESRNRIHSARLCCLMSCGLYHCVEGPDVIPIWIQEFTGHASAIVHGIQVANRIVWPLFSQASAASFELSQRQNFTKPHMTRPQIAATRRKVVSLECSGSRKKFVNQKLCTFLCSVIISAFCSRRSHASQLITNRIIRKDASGITK